MSGKVLHCKNTDLSYIKLNSNFRPDVPPDFLKEDDETEFEGFKDDEIDNDNLSVNEYSSESENEENASETESEESDEGIDQPQPAHPRADEGARSGNQCVPVRIVNWSEKIVTENIAAFTATGPVNVLERDKREVDFFHLLFPVFPGEHLTLNRLGFLESSTTRGGQIPPPCVISLFEDQ